MTQAGAPPPKTPHSLCLFTLLSFSSSSSSSSFSSSSVLPIAEVPLSCFLWPVRARVCGSARTRTNAPVARKRAGCDAVRTRSGRTDGRNDLSRLINKKKPSSLARWPTNRNCFLSFFSLSLFFEDTCYCVSRSQFGSGRGCKSCSRRRKSRSMGLFLLTAARLTHWHKHQGAGGELSPSIQLPVSVVCPRTITVLCWPNHVLSSVEVGEKICLAAFHSSGLV